MSETDYCILGEWFCEWCRACPVNYIDKED